jgi:hypothetical protein
VESQLLRSKAYRDSSKVLNAVDDWKRLMVEKQWSDAAGD